MLGELPAAGTPVRRSATNLKSVASANPAHEVQAALTHKRRGTILSLGDANGSGLARRPSLESTCSGRNWNYQVCRANFTSCL